jgi:hypothetical protein
METRRLGGLMNTTVPRNWIHKSVALVMGVTLVAGLLASSVAAQAPSGQCPQAMAVADVRAGQMATGFTVRKGRTVESFGAEVLGVLPDGIAPGRDMIVVDTSGPLIEDAGGIWFGMSGSPVYHQGKLMGALAFGLSFGPSSIAGLTPAEDMMEVLSYPSDPDDGGGGGFFFSSKAKVRLTERLRKSIARSTHTPTSQVSPNMERLRVPLSVSGVGSRGMEQVRSAIEREELALVPYAGSAANATSVAQPGAAFQPGETFAGALSYGDITFAGVGTATFTCNGMTMAFGHPFFFSGDTQMGANAGDTLTIVSDPFFGAYKLANVAETLGMLDQDRLAGIRAVLGAQVPTTPITSSVTSLDLSRTQEGETDVVMQETVPFLTFIHMFTNIDSVFDQISQGGSSVTWTIQGTRESGAPWTLARENKFVSEFDISFGSLFELEEFLYLLLFNDFEEVEITSVDVDVSVEEAIKTYNVQDILVRQKGEYQDVRKVKVDPGGTIKYRVMLRPHDAPKDGSADVALDQRLTVPSSTRHDGQIVVSRASSNGGFDFFCFLFGEECAEEDKKIKSFDDLLEALAAEPKDYELSSELQMGPRERVKDEIVAALDQVIQGKKRIKVIVRGSGRRGGRGSEFIVGDKCC